MATTGDSRNVRRRTNCVHSPSAQLLAPLSPRILLSLSLFLILFSRPRTFLTLSFSVSFWAARPTDDSVLALTSHRRLTEPPTLSVQLHATFSPLAFSLKFESDSTADASFFRHESENYVRGVKRYDDVHGRCEGILEGCAKDSLNLWRGTVGL